jgi:dTDP-4-dehydrorhamnose 3,5-epimerase-like enzyme
VVRSSAASDVYKRQVVIPAGVAHSLLLEGSDDAIMVYGTTTRFDPASEGRIADGVERAGLPLEWQAYLDGKAC